MRIRTVIVVFAILLVATFVALNWNAFTTPASLNLLVTSVEAPPALIMLALFALGVLAGAVYMAFWQAQILRESRRHAKELQAQRQLADSAEASRFTELRAALADEMARLGERLSAAQSNLPEEGDGRKVWAQHVRSARVDPEKVAAHVAVRTLVTPTELTHAVPGFVVEVVDVMERRSGRARMIASQLRVRSALTEAATTWCFAGLYLGEQHVTGGVRPPPSAAEWTTITEELSSAFKTADVFAAQRVIDHHFPGAQLSLGALLPGRRERVIAAVLGEALHRAEDQLGEAYDQQAPLIRWLVARELPVPEVLHAIAEGTLRRRVLTNLRADHASFQALRDQLVEAAEVRVSLDTPEIALAASEGLRHLIDRVAADGEIDPAAIETVARAAEITLRMKSVVDLWFAQNATWRLLQRVPELREKGHTKAVQDLERLAKALRLAPKA